MDMYLCDNSGSSRLNATVGFYHVIIPFEYLRPAVNFLLAHKEYYKPPKSFYRAMLLVMEDLP